MQTQYFARHGDDIIEEENEDEDSDDEKSSKADYKLSTGQKDKISSAY